MTPDPAAEYSSRLTARLAEVANYDRRLDRVGRARLAVVGLGVIAAVALAATGQSVAWALVAAGPLAGLFVAGRTRAVGRQRAARTASYYRASLDRVGGAWAGQGPNGNEFVRPDHPYAADLDLFGDGSLFQRICAAQTRAGTARIAHWLSAGAAAVTVRARQEMVADLRDRIDLREQLVALAPAADPADFAPLASWGTDPTPGPTRGRRAAVRVLAGYNVLAAVGWLLLDTPVSLVLIGLLASAAVAGPLRAWARAVTGPVDRLADDLVLLELLLTRLGAEPFNSLQLIEMRDRLGGAGAAVGRLRGLAGRAAAGRNLVYLPAWALSLGPVRAAFGYAGWRRTHGPHVAGWLDAVAELEALGSLARYAYENPADPFPTVLDGPDPVVEADGLSHPLLPAGVGVANPVRLGPGCRLLIVSGSNMAGKSTYLRAIGTNVVLALAGGPVRATTMTVTPVRLGATMRVQDSLAAGKSRFLAEVERVRDILAAAAGPMPVLFLLDELFAGTNSADRQAGAAAVVRKLLAGRAIGLVTTHDLALAGLADMFPGEAANGHFADQVTAAGPAFDYALRPGIVPHGNGVALMRAVGLEV